jgi:hypothetical protein
MAIATEDVTTTDQTETAQTEPTNIADAPSKRKRVDLAKLAAENPHEKVSVSFVIPAELRIQVRQAAEKAEKSEPDYLRDLVCNNLGYTLPDGFIEKRGRTGTLTEDERKAQQAEKRDTVSAVLAKIQENPEMAKMLAAMGIDPTKLPKVRGPKAKKDDNATE